MQVVATRSVLTLGRFLNLLTIDVLRQVLRGISGARGFWTWSLLFWEGPSSLLSFSRVFPLSFRSIFITDIRNSYRLVN